MKEWETSVSRVLQQQYGKEKCCKVIYKHNNTLRTFELNRFFSFLMRNMHNMYHEGEVKYHRHRHDHHHHHHQHHDLARASLWSNQSSSNYFTSTCVECKAACVGLVRLVVSPFIQWVSTFYLKSIHFVVGWM